MVFTYQNSTFTLNIGYEEDILYQSMFVLSTETYGTFRYNEIRK